jgi:hypothetical protein
MKLHAFNQKFSLLIWRNILAFLAILHPIQNTHGLTKLKMSITIFAKAATRSYPEPRKPISNTQPQVSVAVR